MWKYNKKSAEWEMHVTAVEFTYFLFSRKLAMIISWWFPVVQEVERLNIEVMTSKQMQERLLASLDEREEMEIRIEDLG